eukprot:TRINITY_DN2023_c0_g1_i5.p1 TRINITY_DN2023_c0_g1~~TRINITY_DN2023_c0_g1_i5.p1  ORF type:complete len:170 (-),score=65.57 TRINITY_DN2023_c0_g1_i5:31-540(-)
MDTATLLSQLGCVASLTFSALGSAFATAKIGMGMVEDLNGGVVAGKEEYKSLINGQPARATSIYKLFLLIIISGVPSIYGLIMATIINAQIQLNLTLEKSYSHIGAGLLVGLACLASGYGLGVFGHKAAIAYRKDQSTLIPSLLISVFLEAIALYGLIIGLIAVSHVPM